MGALSNDTNVFISSLCFLLASHAGRGGESKRSATPPRLRRDIPRRRVAATPRPRRGDRGAATAERHHAAGTPSAARSSPSSRRRRTKRPRESSAPGSSRWRAGRAEIEADSASAQTVPTRVLAPMPRARVDGAATLPANDRGDRRRTESRISAGHDGTFFVAVPPSIAGRGPAAGCHVDIPRGTGSRTGRGPAAACRPRRRRGRVTEFPVENGALDAAASGSFLWRTGRSARRGDAGRSATLRSRASSAASSASGSSRA